MTWARRSGALLALAGFVLAALAMLAARAGAVVFGTEVPDGGQSAPWVASIWYSESADGDPGVGHLVSVEGFRALPKPSCIRRWNEHQIRYRGRKPLCHPCR